MSGRAETTGVRGAARRLAVRDRAIGSSVIARRLRSTARSVLGLTLVSVLLLVGVTLGTTAATGRAWNAAERNEFRKLAALSRFDAAFGYDGVIHTLKNYVLRADPADAESTARSIAEARHALAAYRAGTVISDHEAAHLAQLDELVSEYESALGRVGVHGLAIAEADRLAKVDDTPYARAILELRTLIHQDMEERTRRVHASMDRARAVVLGVGVLVASVVACVSLGLTGRMVRRVLEEHRRTESLASFARHSTNGMVRTDARRRITWVNEGFERISGYSEAEMLGKSPGELLQFEGTDAGTVDALRSCLSRGEGFKGRILNRSKSGRDYWLELEIIPERDEQGELVGYLGIESDVTELVEARASLAQLHATCRRLTQRACTRGRICARRARRVGHSVRA